MRHARALILLLALAAAPAGAQTIVTSAGPDNVEITLYRAPGRSFTRAMDVDWLDGYALISERRRVTIPAGESEVRFEGVAGGMVPQSAIVGGFAEDVVERNRDAYLLSPESLLDRSLSRRVRLRRTSRATGATREHEAVIRSGAGGAVVLQTEAGYEALRCTGLPEALVYDGVPAGLAARPTLSVRVRARQPETATVTLSYLSNGFDWQANYVATLSPDGGHVDLFAWLVLASSDETSFRDADAQAVAGRINRERTPADDDRGPGGGRLELRCWPQARTSDIPLDQPTIVRRGLQGEMRMEDLTNDLPGAGEENIIITGSSRARQEELGDLKLYRIPGRVTVASHSTKQVAFLEQQNVPVRMVYRQRFHAGNDADPMPAGRVLVTRNRREEQLGMPLPGGQVQLFTNAGGRPILLGEGVMIDRAVGEDVEIEIGQGTGVIGGTERVRDDDGDDDDREDYVLTVTNDLSVPVGYEAEFRVEEQERFAPRTRLGTRNGRPLWTVTVPANGTATLRYRVTEPRR